MISNRQNPNEIIDLKPAAATKSFIDKREKQKEIVSKWQADTQLFYLQVGSIGKTFAKLKSLKNPFQK